MRELDDNGLLREYVEHGSEEAFATLVTRHVNKVYSVALRHTGSPHQAEEITQVVFVILAKKSRHLSKRVILAGWLYQTARLSALTFLKSEIRRAHREREAHMQNILNEPETDAWPRIAPLLETAMAGLNDTDRHAIVLRYFDGRSMREVGTALGTGEDAAKMRVSRALEKLRRFFAKRGVALSAAALAAGISANAVQAAPVALANTATALALSKGAAAGGSTLTLIKGALKTMAWTKAKTGIASALVAASIIIPFVMQHQAQARVREMDESLRRQSKQLAGVQGEHERLAGEVEKLSLSKKQTDDLQKLRAEIGPLRQQADEVAQLRAQNQELQRKAGSGDRPSQLQIKEQIMAKMGYGKNWAIAFYQYAAKNGGQFPTTFDQAASFMTDKAKNQADVSTDQFEIVFQGAPASPKKPQDVILFQEKDAMLTRVNPDGSQNWTKVYFFADGHGELHGQPQSDFSAYEQQHGVAAATAAQ